MMRFQLGVSVNKDKVRYGERWREMEENSFLLKTPFSASKMNFGEEENKLSKDQSVRSEGDN